MARGRVRRMAKTRFPLRSVRVVRKARGRARRVVRRRTPKKRARVFRRSSRFLGLRRISWRALGSASRALRTR
jgi:hypothetical protein